VEKFYDKIKPICAFKVYDEDTKLSFYYVTSVEFDWKSKEREKKRCRVSFRKKSSQSDITPTKVAHMIEENSRITNMLEVSAVLDK
jgi:hypothetical protein